MKQSIPPGVMAGIIAVILLVIGFFAYKNFFAPPDYSNGLTPAQDKAVMDSQAKDMGTSIMHNSKTVSPRQQVMEQEKAQSGK